MTTNKLELMTGFKNNVGKDILHVKKHYNNSSK